MNFIEQSGFTNITIQKEKAIVVLDDVLTRYPDETNLPSLKPEAPAYSV